MAFAARYHTYMDYKSLRNREFDTTLRVLQAYPEDKINLKPADKSRTAGELAKVLVAEERIVKILIEKGATDLSALAPMEKADTMADIISGWQNAVSTNRPLIEGLSREDLARTVDFYGMQIALGDALWFELLDHIHHRGQLSVYLRLAGGKVPSIYGPSADVQR